MQQYPFPEDIASGGTGPAGGGTPGGEGRGDSASEAVARDGILTMDVWINRRALTHGKKKRKCIDPAMMQCLMWHTTKIKYGLEVGKNQSIVP